MALMLRSRFFRDAWAFGVLVCLGIAAACAFALINPILLPRHLTPGVSFFFLVSTCGALGGILYSTRNRLIEIPHHANGDQNKISLGYLADILGGIGGAYAIFMLLPYEFHKILPSETVREANRFIVEFEQIRSLIQIIAVSMIGGYGGRALIERVQSDLFKKVEETSQKTDSMQAEIRRDAMSKSLSYRIIEDPKHPPSASTIMQLKQDLASVMFTTRSEIFYRALGAREKYAIELINILDTIDLDGFTPETFFKVFREHAKTFYEIRGVMQAAVLIFKLLLEATPAEIEADEQRMLHRYHAQLAYAMKDLLYCNAEQFDHPATWSEIIRHLDRAIELRPTDAYSADSRDLFSFYELNKAIALIEKDGSYARQQPTPASECEVIIALLRKAAAEAKRRDVELNMIFPIRAWLAVNPGMSVTP